MKSLFERSDYYDVKFRVEGKEIPAYKGILVSRSPYFPKMFTSLDLFGSVLLIQIGGMKESHNEIIEVPDTKYEVYHSKYSHGTSFLKQI